MDWANHAYRVGASAEAFAEIPTDPAELDAFVSRHRRKIEPWLSAVFQAEHLNLLVGSGFTTSIGHAAHATATSMGLANLTSTYGSVINTHSAAMARRMGRGSANIEDQLRSAIAAFEGLSVIHPESAAVLKADINHVLANFLGSLFSTERAIAAGETDRSSLLLQSFLLSFASRAASRERLHIFTTNYDRLIERGCDLAGLRLIDRFVGALSPVFRNTRVEVDYHYNPPGIRGEPRFMEGVVRYTKLHGSLDWSFDADTRQISRVGIPFGPSDETLSMPASPIDTVMIYPNPAKDVETTQYPYAELFRDFASATCQPNSVVVTYGYGFGDDHINRVLLDMLSIPSAHLVIIIYHVDDRIEGFISKTRPAQVSILAGSHFGDLGWLVDEYLPKPALDYITGRMTDLLKNRPAAEAPTPPDRDQKPEVDDFAGILG